MAIIGCKQFNERNSTVLLMSTMEIFELVVNGGDYWGADR